MKLYGKATEVGARIIEAFRTPERLPAALAPVFLEVTGDIPCRRWSIGNQMLVALSGYADARGFRQWERVGRRVKKGERAMYILSPCVRKRTSSDGEERTFVSGFRATAVFGREQTEGDPLPALDTSFVDALPFVDVARAWGLSVQAYSGKGVRYLGKYTGTGIAIGVENLSTWAHELVHAADDRRGELVEHGQHWRSEIVAELGGAVLLAATGREVEADLGGCWRYVSSYARDAGLEPVRACLDVLSRIEGAVRLILKTARESAEKGAA